MISANGGWPAHRYTPQVTPRWPRGSEPASETHNQEDSLILLGEFFDVFQQTQRPLNLETCEFMLETKHYLWFDIGYGWQTPGATTAETLMDAEV